MEDDKYQATVSKVITSGRHGPYAVSYCEKIGVVTFSLETPVWNEREWPTPGTIVILEDVRRKSAGWRAERARFLRPTDNPEKRREQ